MLPETNVIANNYDFGKWFIGNDINSPHFIDTK